MERANHTPGPWRATAHIVYAGEFRVATVQAVGVKANRDAELIAAAPELLAALEQMAADYEYNELYGDALEAALAAIAKAKGE